MFQDTETWGRRPALPVAKQGHHVRDGGEQGLQTTSGCARLSHASSPRQARLQADALPVQEVLMEPRACVGACSQAVMSETEQGCCNQGSGHMQAESSARKAGSGPDAA